MAAAAACLLALAAAMLLAVTANSAQAADAVIAIDVDPNTPGIQSSAIFPEGTDPVGVDVVVQNANAIGAFEFQVSFDAISLEFLGWALGPFLGSTGRQVTCQEIITENTIRIGCTTTGPPPPDGPSGDGVLVTLGFRPKFTGQTCFRLMLVETAEIFGHPLPTTGQGGCLLIEQNTPTPIPTFTSTPTATMTAAATRTPFPTITMTRTVSPSRTAAATPSVTGTHSPTTSPTAHIGGTQTAAPRTVTATRTAAPRTAVRTATPSVTQTPGPCPHSVDFWRTHVDQWPATDLTLGSLRYTRDELIALLNMADSDDASVVLARQVIAAKLNAGIGAGPSLDDLTLADSLLSASTGKLPFGVRSSTFYGQGMLWVAADLTTSNERCSDDASAAGQTPTAVNNVLGTTRQRTPPSGLPSTGASGGFGSEAATWVITAMSIVIGVLLVVVLKQTFFDEAED